MQQLQKKTREQGKVYRITKTVRGKYRTGTSNAPIADKQEIPLITETEKKGRLSDHFSWHIRSRGRS